MEEHFISIVLPTYNGEKYICESVDCILNQTYTNWELIIVDDCSTDRTLQIINHYAEKDKRIRVLHNEKNYKLPKALNVGFSVAQGDLLTWTSDDNRFLPNALEVMQRYFGDKSVHMICANMYVIDADGIRREEFIFQNDGKLCFENNVGACFMYTREVYEQVGDYDVELFCVEDYDYWIRVEKAYGKILRIPDALIEYRVHGESLTARKREFVNKQKMNLRNKHMEYILQSMKNDKKLLFRIYMELLEGGDDAVFIANFVKYIPELQYEANVERNQKQFIIFGAGEYGERAWSVLQDKVFCFADNDRSKAGSVKKGLRIMAFDEVVKLADDYYIMIAVSGYHGYQIMKQLSDYGITNYCTYQYYIWKKEK